MPALPPDDQLAIERLYARYNHAIHRADGEAWAACFSADGRFSNRGGSREGAAELAAYANDFSRADNARYWINNLILEAAGDGGATGTCYLEILHVAQPGGVTKISLTGIYTDELKKIDGEWRFSSRHIARDL